MRLAVIALARAPYWEPLYISLGGTSDIKMRVFYLQPKDSIRGWTAISGSYDAVQVPCLTPEWLYRVPVLGVVNAGLVQSVRQFHPDCVLIHGYSYISHFRVIRWAIRTRTPYVLWGDSNAETLPGSSMKRAWLRYICRCAACVLTIGSSNQAFWTYYGVGPNRLFRAPLAVDNEHFASRAELFRRRKQAERDALGLPSGPLLLYVGRFAREKNLETLLHAVAASGRLPLSLVLVGDGPEKRRLQALIRQLRLNCVFHFGFQDHTMLPKFYGIADALVLPSSYEPWGLVVNEAMASGLPVLLSRSTGCRPDLLEEGINGFSFEENSMASITACLGRFCTLDDQQLRRMGEQSSAKISAWTYTQTLAGIRRALDSLAYCH